VSCGVALSFIVAEPLASSRDYRESLGDSRIAAVVRVPYSVGKALLAAARLIPLSVPNQEPVAYQQGVRDRAKGIYDSFYSRFIAFPGKDIGELGATQAAMHEYLKYSPRHYYAMNINIGDDDFSEFQAHIDDGRVTLVRTETSVIPLPDDSLDVVISENCFEHLVDYEGMMRELHRVLRPGGYVLSQFSPLYHSPYGAHLFCITKLPYVHLLTDDATLERLMREEAERVGRVAIEYDLNQYKTLNGLTPQQFSSPLRPPLWKLHTFDSWPILQSDKFPGPFSKWLTHRLRIAVEKL
jgi:SAM-dependent methyltransferase